MTRKLNTSNTKWAPLTLIFVMVTALSLLTIGCSNDNVIESTVTEFDSQQGLDNLTLTDQIIDEALGQQERSFAKTLDRRSIRDLPEQVRALAFATGIGEYVADGFYITVSFGDEESVFRFPANAVTNDTQHLLGDDGVITVQGVRNQTGNTVTYQYTCAPHGLVFTDAVQLTQPYNAPTGTNLGMYYLDDTVRGGTWELEEVTTVSGGLAYFDIWHFSKYGISR